MLTLKEVRSMVSENYKGRVLTRKQLQEKEIVVKEKIDKDTEVIVNLLRYGRGKKEREKKQRRKGSYRKKKKRTG